jgi:hypothetical protein
MKKILFLLLLLSLLGRGLGGGLLFAQKVSNLAVSPGTVTFDVEWVVADLPALWSDTMWVFVDYNKNGKMERLLLTGGTLTEHSANTLTPQSPDVGSVIKLADNDKGAWVVGDARSAGSFSATVQLFTGETTIAGACAYASSYPPVGNWIDDTKIGFTGTPGYIVTLTPEGGGADETVVSGGTFLLPCSYTVSSFTDKTGAPGIIKCLAPANLMFATPFTTICAGATVTLTASATGAASYSIDGNTWQSEMAFEVAPTSTTHYTLYAQTAEGCITSVADAAVVTIYPVLLPGEIATASTSTMAGINPNVTIASPSSATGGSSNITYQWVRTGTSGAILTGANAIYTLSSDVVGNYWTSGTYYFNRYAKDATCNTEWVAATGTYTLYVVSPAPGSVQTTFCEECCWDGDAASTWVNCHVTTTVYPFDNPSMYTFVLWSGNNNYSGTSDRNGRANTAAISSTAGSAVRICKDLGTGWYLPAYEELVNMSDANSSSTYPPLNGRSGAGILRNYTILSWIWTSTEYYGNGGRISTNINNATNQGVAVRAHYDGRLDTTSKISYGNYSMRCAWRP